MRGNDAKSAISLEAREKSAIIGNFASAAFPHRRC
jgi:hypothetical protein